MNKLEKKLWAYSRREVEIRKAVANLDKLKRQHDDKTNRDFGIVEGEVITLERLVKIIARVTSQGAN